MRISNSFSEGEVQALDFIVQTLLRGGVPTMVTRHKEFASLCRKVLAMKQKVHEKHQQREAAAAESSVGVIGAPRPGDSADEAAAPEAPTEPTEPTESAEDLAKAV
jgi:hypothetical protein